MPFKNGEVLHCPRCPCCLSQVVTYGNKTWSIWGETYRLKRCSDCRTLSTDPLPSDEVIERIYTEVFCHQWFSDHYAFKYLDSRSRLKRYRSFLGKSLLDYGGSYGYFSSACRAFGITTSTLDPFAHRPVDLMERRWDSIVALHVLEHSNNPDRTLNEFKRYLRPGGSIIVAVPNGESLGYHKEGVKWVWAQPPLLHLFHFSALGLIRLFQRHGFKVTWLEYSDRWDANIVCDVKLSGIFRYLDKGWSAKLPPLSRKFVTYRNGILRNICLGLSGFFVPGEKTLSELQVFATV